MFTIMSLIDPTGEESSTRFASWDWSFFVSLLCIIYDGLCRSCWFGTLLCNGSRHPHLLRIC